MHLDYASLLDKAVAQRPAGRLLNEPKWGAQASINLAWLSFDDLRLAQRIDRIGSGDRHASPGRYPDCFAKFNTGG